MISLFRKHNDVMEVEPAQESEENKEQMMDKETGDFKDVKNTVGMNLAPYYTKFDIAGQKQLLEDANAYIDSEVKALQAALQEADAKVQKLRAQVNNLSENAFVNTFLPLAIPSRP